MGTEYGISGRPGSTGGATSHQPPTLATRVVRRAGDAVRDGACRIEKGAKIVPKARGVIAVVGGELSDFVGRRCETL
jgi:hypothetical protein